MRIQSQRTNVYKSMNIKWRCRYVLTIYMCLSRQWSIAVILNESPRDRDETCFCKLNVVFEFNQVYFANILVLHYSFNSCKIVTIFHNWKQLDPNRGVSNRVSSVQFSSFWYDNTKTSKKETLKTIWCESRHD